MQWPIYRLADLVHCLCKRQHSRVTESGGVVRKLLNASRGRLVLAAFERNASDKWNWREEAL